MKKWGLIVAIAVIAVAVLVLAQTGKLSFAAIAGDDVTYCNGYSWISCVEKEGVAPISVRQEGTPLFGTPPPKPKCFNYKCKLTNFVPDFPDPRGFTKLFVGGVQTPMPATVARGQVFWFGYTVYTQEAGRYYFVPVNEALLWTGSAGSTVGSPVLGADGCTFNPLQYDKILMLFNENDNQISENQIITVPVGYAYSYVDSEKRHDCGRKSETCSSDTDCTGHPLTWKSAGDSECSNGYLNRYGCRQYGESCVEWDSDLKLRCLEFAQMRRCEVVERKPVQCCPYTDVCGQGVCEPSNFTCQQPPEVDCTQDWECGQTQYCDRDSKQLTAKKCINNECQSQSLQNVECCYDIDCPNNYYCDKLANYICRQRVLPKSECPYTCCEDLVQFFEKPAPPGMVCCPDHTVAESLDKCDAGTTPSNPSAKEECFERSGDGIFILGYTWSETGGFLGLFPAGDCHPIYNLVLLGIVAIFVVGAITIFFVRKRFK